jgi:hypothetical protein
LQPIFGHVDRREDVVFRVFGVEGQGEVAFADAFLLACRDGSLDRDRLRALDDGGDDCAADQVATVEDVLFAAAQQDREELTFLPIRKLEVDQCRDEQSIACSTAARRTTDRCLWLRRKRCRK